MRGAVGVLEVTHRQHADEPRPKHARVRVLEDVAGDHPIERDLGLLPEEPQAALGHGAGRFEQTARAQVVADEADQLLGEVEPPGKVRRRVGASAAQRKDGLLKAVERTPPRLRGNDPVGERGPQEVRAVAPVDRAPLGPRAEVEGEQIMRRGERHEAPRRVGENRRGLGARARRPSAPASHDRRRRRAAAAAGSSPRTGGC